MKGGGSSSSSYGSLPLAKRRWRGLVVGVLGLVLLSMLVPLVFLLGLHNGFHSPPAYPTEQRTSDSIDLKVYDRHSRGKSGNQSKGDQSTAHVDDLIRRLEPTLPKEFKREPVRAAVNNTIGSSVSSDAPKPHDRENRTRTGRIVEGAEHMTTRTGGKLEVAEHMTTRAGGKVEVAEHMTTSAGGKVEVAEHMTTRTSGMVEVAEHMKSVTDEIEKSCEVKFGSYCLWRQEHREKMKDDMVKKMKDQLFVARAYYPSIAKLPAHEKLSREMKQNIQEFERLLSETTTDADIPRQIDDKLQKMEAVIAQAKSFVVDCNNVDKKLRQLVDLTEDEANFHMRQSAFLYQLSAQTMPKSLHCLAMRLTVEYFRSPPPDLEPSVADKYNNPALHHYVIFSSNVLASSAVINSTVMHSKESGNQVFHVLTDQQNYFAMKLWFYENTYKDATVHVLNVEDFNLSDKEATPLHLSSAEEFRISFPSTDTLSTTHIRTEYISIFSHLHYLLPKIFGNFKKVVVLDDDVVVQRDLSALWSLEMEGKVIGATQFCAVRLGQLRNFLGDNISNANSCAWMSGLNVVDLVRWRELDVTETFWKSVQKQPSAGEELFQAAALRASLFAFQDLVYALDDTWVLSGLGHDYSLDAESVQKAAVLHYNGNMKPWIEIGIPKYKGYWRTFVNRENQFLSDCNVNP